MIPPIMWFQVPSNLIDLKILKQDNLHLILMTYTLLFCLSKNSYLIQNICIHYKDFNYSYVILIIYKQFHVHNRFKSGNISK